MEQEEISPFLREQDSTIVEAEVGTEWEQEDVWIIARIIETLRI